LPARSARCAVPAGNPLRIAPPRLSDGGRIRYAPSFAACKKTYRGELRKKSRQLLGFRADSGPFKSCYQSCSESCSHSCYCPVLQLRGRPQFEPGNFRENSLLAGNNREFPLPSSSAEPRASFKQQPPADRQIFSRSRSACLESWIFDHERTGNNCQPFRLLVKAVAFLTRRTRGLRGGRGGVRRFRSSPLRPFVGALRANQPSPGNQSSGNSVPTASSAYPPRPPR